MMGMMRGLAWWSLLAACLLGPWLGSCEDEQDTPGSGAGTGVAAAGGTSTGAGGEAGAAAHGASTAGGTSAGGTGGTPAGCSPGQTESQICGACGSGSQTRSCGPSGSWDGWGACANEDTGYPLSPVDGQPVCPPYTRPAIFLSPHADDESIAMGGAIVEHLAAGRQVFVELMTHGARSGVFNTLKNGGTCSWHSGTHSYDLTEEEFGQARMREFVDAVTRLAVTGYHVNDYPEGCGDGTCTGLTQAQVQERLDWWRLNPGAELIDKAFKGAVGSPFDPGGGGAFHPDHTADWAGLKGYRDSQLILDTRGYLVYHYTTHNGSGFGAHTLGDSARTAKCNALEAYRVWDPANGRYAIGRHSVATLMDTACSDGREYVVYYP